jgi:hypothetical protein
MTCPNHIKVKSARLKKTGGRYKFKGIGKFKGNREFKCDDNGREPARSWRYASCDGSGWDWGAGLPLWRRVQLSRVVKVRVNMRSM